MLLHLVDRAPRHTIFFRLLLRIASNYNSFSATPRDCLVRQQACLAYSDCHTRPATPKHHAEHQPGKGCARIPSSSCSPRRWEEPGGTRLMGADTLNSSFVPISSLHISSSPAALPNTGSTCTVLRSRFVFYPLVTLLL